MLLTVKGNQWRLSQQIVFQFRGHRHLPVMKSDVEDSCGNQVRWQPAMQLTPFESVRWVPASWIVELVSSGRQGCKSFRQVHDFLTILRTRTKALLRRCISAE
ncbi:hypothetical protein [Cyanobium sp. Aljojuca 7D2]|uniref:hypothetical protein n=1 Tax=Cyanobium sp. Aljojuca 7D2 TaxID=2823698 RepID=UPI0020CEA6DA|nr:hypothetical protein [Cyanobium sp. Aljojuca 7D2]